MLTGSRELYLVNGICLVIVDNADLASVCEVQQLYLFNVDYIVERKADLDAVALVMTPENDSLEGFHPVFGALCAVCSEVVRAVVGLKVEVEAILVLVRHRR